MTDKIDSQLQSITKHNDISVQKCEIDEKRNPILNSPDDITEELIQRIIDNNLDSLKINYEFTRRKNKGEDKREWKKEQNISNPFWLANDINPLKRIEFRIEFGSKVSSLAYAFYFF